MRRQAPHRRAFRPELVRSLEARCLLAGPAIARIAGTIPTGGHGDVVTIHLDPADFQLAGPRTLLTFAATDATGQAVSIAPIRTPAGRAARNQVSTAEGGRIAALGLGSYSFVVGMNAGAGSSYTVRVQLAGDVNGSGRVDRADLAIIRANLGRSPGSPNDDPSSDVDGSRRTTATDLALAALNLRDASTLRPLAADLTTPPADASNHLVRLVAHSRAGATLRLSRVDGTSTTTTTTTAIADLTGQATFTALVAVGSTEFRVVAVDRFGQRIESRTTVQRTTLANYLGAAFEPYVKPWNGQAAPNAQVPPFNSYTSGNASVANQIALIAPTFARIATYGAGYAGYDPTSQPWNQVDSNWQNAPAAAAYNLQQGSLALTVSQGIYQQVQGGTIANAQQQAEVSDAFADASNANATYAGTVTRLIFTNEYVTDAATTDQVNALITANKAQAHAMGLEVGVRSQTFGQLTNPSSPYLTQLRNLINNVDFIMCNLYPSQQASQQGIAASVSEVAAQYNAIKAAAVALNPSIEVLIGETGWPTQGVSFNDPGGTLNTVANAQAYFQAIGAWANSNQVQVMYFEAIDEPWKSNQNDTNAADPQGYQGAEGHYGRWYYTTNDDTGTFVAKW